MRVYGELEKAQLEKLSADPTGDDLYEGRLWINTTDNITRYYDGSAVRSISDNELIGVSAGDGDLGTFTGDIITDNTDIKSALQELEVGFFKTVYDYRAAPVAAENDYTVMHTYTITTYSPGMYSIHLDFYQDCDTDVFPRYKLTYGSGNFPHPYLGRTYDTVSGSSFDPLIPRTGFMEFSVSATDNARMYFFLNNLVLDSGTHTFNLWAKEFSNEHLNVYNCKFIMK